ncbi:charged multivesicular body protein 6-A-like [Limulus polyphemus]|uniref:Charged multivesicular body protein 6-A-like n=1 Tax=Limulus polyphemus TaxID=6850 RepID=A0ABM1BCC8_LIMPO|nr:charged multivesicular body protein 6-A-like [Limulus polyphemus]
MGILFGKHNKKVSRVTEQDKAILQLKQQRDKLKQYQKKISINLEKERCLAKQLLQNGKKERARLLLKKKRFMEQMLEKTDAQLMNLENMAHDLEFAQIEIQVLDGLKVGNDSLKKMHELISVEDVEKILDETREGIEKQKEIDELLGEGFTQEDEEAISAELDAIIEESLPEAPVEAKEEEISLPEVPVEEPEVPEMARKAKVLEPKKVMVEAS